jgi:hypothetical protein
MKKQHLTAIGALILLSSSAMAGLYQPAPIDIVTNADGSGSARGDMVTARFTKNNVEYLGCGVRTFSDGAGGVLSFAFCQASTAAGVIGFCSTEDPRLIESLAAISDYSFITFSWGADGVCTQIGTSTQSLYLPAK